MYSLGWLISDSIRCILCVYMFVWGLTQLRDKRGSAALTSVRWCGTVVAAVNFTYFLGWHAPLYLGWRFEAIGQATQMIIMFLCAHKLFYLVLVARFSSVRRTHEIKTQAHLLAFSLILAGSLLVTATIGILITGKFWFILFRAIGSIVCFLSCGVLFCFHLYKLFGVASKLVGKIESKAVFSKAAISMEEIPTMAQIRTGPLAISGTGGLQTLSSVRDQKRITTLEPSPLEIARDAKNKKAKRKILLCFLGALFMTVCGTGIGLRNALDAVNDRDKTFKEWRDRFKDKYYIGQDFIAYFSCTMNWFMLYYAHQ